MPELSPLVGVLVMGVTIFVLWWMASVLNLLFAISSYLSAIANLAEAILRDLRGQDA